MAFRSWRFEAVAEQFAQIHGQQDWPIVAVGETEGCHHARRCHSPTFDVVDLEKNRHLHYRRQQALGVRLAAGKLKAPGRLSLTPCPGLPG